MCSPFIVHYYSFEPRPRRHTHSTQLTGATQVSGREGAIFVTHARVARISPQPHAAHSQQLNRQHVQLARACRVRLHDRYVALITGSARSSLPATDHLISGESSVAAPLQATPRVGNGEARSPHPLESAWPPPAAWGYPSGAPRPLYQAWWTHAVPHLHSRRAQRARWRWRRTPRGCHPCRPGALHSRHLHGHPP